MRLYPMLRDLSQDPCFQVRMTFLTKLIALLTPRKLAPRFNVIPFLTVLDPEPEVKNAVSPRFFGNVKIIIQGCCRLLHTYPISFEACLPVSCQFAIGKLL